MRTKLHLFSAFANSLLPHETAYLLKVQQFEDPVRLEILRQIDRNCRSIGPFTPFDENQDKRKFSNLKSWITERLAAIDVDVQYEWMAGLDRKIMTDNILPEEEKALLRAIRQYEHPSFFFAKFYELAQNYRLFLLVRLRYADHDLVEGFLHQYAEAYRRAIDTREKIHQATKDIVQQYAQADSESMQWEQWLSEVFYDETLDGLNRYLALVRLIFIGFNYRQFEPLLEKFDYLDQWFSQGKYYSRRILLNYYSNRLLLHSKFKEFDRAAYYGYLSIRDKTHDYLYYATNLAAVLLRQHKKEEALEVMKSAYPELKQTQNFHTRIGFVAFYLKCLNQNNRYRNAEGYGASFLRAYRKEILDYRWHLFFTAYFETLLGMGDYARIIKVARANRLLDLEKKYRANANYLPTISWYYSLAECKEGVHAEEELYLQMIQFVEALGPHSDKLPVIGELLQELHPHIPKVVNRVQEYFSRKNLLLVGH